MGSEGSWVLASVKRAETGLPVPSFSIQCRIYRAQLCPVGSQLP